MNNDIDWDEIREDDRRLDRWDDDDEQPEERAPDWTLRDEDIATINEWLRRK